MPDEKKTTPTPDDDNTTPKSQQEHDGERRSWAARAWDDPMRVCQKDGTYATTSGNLGEDDETRVLLANDFRFSIPGSATIKGIEVKIWSKAASGGGGNLVTHVLQLTKGGSTLSESRADHNCDHKWSESFAYQHSGGGPTDPWGFGLNASQVNSSSFGVRFAVENCEGNQSTKPHVDSIEVIVWYNDGSPTDDFTEPHLPHYAYEIV